MNTHFNERISVESLKEPTIGIKRKNKRKPSEFEIIESKYKRRGRTPSKVTSTRNSRSQSFSPSPIMEVDSSEDYEASLSKKISSSDSLPSETKLNEYGNRSHPWKVQKIGNG
ncbi:hypothetical protein O181_114042 [Austropuccinia psidii MF-1]|uniref:Uncharacterized protein n=1 Tax=Austropuccinia psidii MF-1 TaxID=1389203 RepID=A0A9Q3PVZ0_9BASI|nr:hypothetical protein [Austropuccinia psidii MF-1]